MSIVDFIAVVSFGITCFCAECVSGTKAGDAEAHNCNEVHNTHWLSPPFQRIPFRVSM